VEELKVAIRSGIIETENQFRQLDEPDGVCVLLACLSGLEMVVANVGDSRAVLGSYKQGSTSALCSRLLTNDHNASNAVEAKLARFRFLQNNQILPPTARPEDYSEQELIEKVKEVMEGMDIISNGRLLTVQLTRSIGDFGLKKYCFNVVSNEPEFTVVRLSEEDRLLILASDGVWATVTADDAVNIVMDRLLNLAAFYDVGPAEALVQEAVRRGSGDDQTALILDLKKYKRCVKWNAEKKGLPDPENGESPLAAAIRKGLFLSDRSCGSPSLLYGSASRAFSAKMARLHARGSFIGSTDVGIFEQQAKEAQPLASSAHSVRNKLKGAAAPAPILGLFEQTAIEGTKAREMEKKKNDFHFRSYRC
jgi:serine/threonine protein phosphatase PrpC